MPNCKFLPQKVVKLFYIIYSFAEKNVYEVFTLIIFVIDPDCYAY